jgi:hypothetical protein
MSTQNLPGGKGWSVNKTDNFTTSFMLIENVEALTSHNPMNLDSLLQVQFSPFTCKPVTTMGRMSPGDKLLNKQHI